MKTKKPIKKRKPSRVYRLAAGLISSMPIRGLYNPRPPGLETCCCPAIDHYSGGQMGYDYERELFAEYFQPRDRFCWQAWWPIDGEKNQHARVFALLLMSEICKSEGEIGHET